jgi:hypothetical protein
MRDIDGGVGDGALARKLSDQRRIRQIEWPQQ